MSRPETPDRIPSEIRDEPNRQARRLLLEELAQQAHYAVAELVFETVHEHGGPGAHGAQRKAADELGMEYERLRSIVKAHPELRFPPPKPRRVTRLE